jgi:diketogulonate reductase-like aldo/keto reductase
VYKNEESVGLALRDSGISRSELYITTKYGGGSVSNGIRASLQKLGLKSVDLYLIHQPRLVSDDFGGAWKKFEKIKDEGLAK